MDIPRTAAIKRRRIRRVAGVSVSLVVLTVITMGLARLKPAAPTVDKATIYTDTVKRGEMVREVWGNGTLVPTQIQLVQADTAGQVERILILPGAAVQADTVIIELTNPELKQAAFETEWQLRAAEAQLEKLKVQLESDRLTQEAAIASLRIDYTVAQMDAEADDQLAKEGLVPLLIQKKSKSRAEEIKSRYEIEQKRLKISDAAQKAQIAVQEAELAKLRALLSLRRQQVENLRVKAGIDGVLQQIGDREMLQVGQRVNPNATLARVVQPTQLKAEIKIPETQAKDVQLLQPALVDTRNGKVAGHVIRIDPAAQSGTVTIDIALDGPLPKGARPDMNVEGTVELERLEDALHVGRPIQGQADTPVGLFKVVNGGREAVRVPVKLGRSSVRFIEIVSGLNEGDQVILSDMSQWDAHDRVRLN
ncbi:MAG TPA: HlyD family efflux transporter periplasmic adaptor subunit [Candidatus Paceibacterota bacterium]|nr:HlyD family efflux transporter periplasmic adaptor subunit [Verrucomicrobiota bacterium]HRY49815.1 HlyD family efflux transporter periplasmic adaptor subunit [Candidatus Paceibacterota bacterium]HSA00583.1 HlyD family efflux transporter periplasmic adaptor subunit [Candidatus Paceibacterota bacterium]